MRKRELIVPLNINIICYQFALLNFTEFSQNFIKQIHQTQLYSSLLFTHFRNQSHEQNTENC